MPGAGWLQGIDIVVDDAYIVQHTVGGPAMSEMDMDGGTSAQEDMPVGAYGTGNVRAPIMAAALGFMTSAKFVLDCCEEASDGRTSHCPSLVCTRLLMDPALNDLDR